jgi:hypothetical protein
MCVATSFDSKFGSSSATTQDLETYTETKSISWRSTYIHTYIHIYNTQFHFINPGKPLGFGYETCPQDVTNTIKRTQIKTHTHRSFKILKLEY